MRDIRYDLSQLEWRELVHITLYEPIIDRSPRIGTIVLRPDVYEWLVYHFGYPASSLNNMMQKQAEARWYVIQGGVAKGHIYFADNADLMLFKLAWI